MGDTPNRYMRIIEDIFFDRYSEGSIEVEFSRDDFVDAANRLGIATPKNLGDILYSFRFRTAFPKTIQETAPEGSCWTIELAGRGKYRFKLKPVTQIEVIPNLQLVETKIPDATPGVVSMYALSDEQALLAKVRYNRLIDLFTGLTCYSLQNHLRTAVTGHGQVETDEVYIGLDKRGIHYILPVQGKGGKDRLGIVQIEQDIAVCKAKFPSLICKPIGAQFIGTDLIALFEFEQTGDGIHVYAERHYRLAPPENISSDELEVYKSRMSE